MVINHNSIHWPNIVPEKVKTLVLGSFNPHNPNGNNPDYYYGRNTNYFWKAIGDIFFNTQQHYFFPDGNLNMQLVSQTMNERKFCFLDIIETVEITGENPIAENQFANQRIYTGFSDGVLFTANHGGVITLQRTYNVGIIDFVNNVKPDKVIHTLGNNRINQNFIGQPAELNGEFLESVLAACNNVGTEIIATSISPSQTNINRNNQYLPLRNWLEENL